MGGPDRHRHRVRACGARGAVHAPADGDAHFSADACCRRRPPRHHGHRRLLHRSSVPRLRSRWPLIPIGLFGLAVQRGVHHWWLLAPAGRGGLGAGARQRRARDGRGRCVGFTVPVLGRHGQPTAELFEHTMRPVSAGFAVPVFAFFAAGVTVGGWSGLGALAAAPDHRRRHRRPGDRQTPRRVRHRVPAGQVHPCQPRRRPGVARRARRRRCWPASGSQFRY